MLKNASFPVLLLYAFMYVTVIALIIYAITSYYPNVVANVFSYAIFLILVLITFLALGERKLLVVPFLLGAFKVVQSLALYYVSSRTYSVESLDILSSELRYSVDLLHTVVFSTSMAELVTILLLTIYLIVTGKTYGKILVVPLALTILSMLFISSSIVNIYHAAYIATLFTLAIIFSYMLKKRENIVTKVFTGKAIALCVVVILLLSILTILPVHVAPLTLNTNYEELLAENKYVVSLSKLGNCSWKSMVYRECQVAYNDTYAPIACFNVSYRICRVNLVTAKLTLPLILLITNSSKALVVPERDYSYSYALTSVLSSENSVAHRFVGLENNTLYYLLHPPHLEDTYAVLCEIGIYMSNKFGPLKSNYAVAGFDSRVSMLFSDLMTSKFNGEEPVLFKPKPLIVFLFGKNSSTTLVYFDEVSGDRFLLKITP